MGGRAHVRDNKRESSERTSTLLLYNPYMASQLRTYPIPMLFEGFYTRCSGRHLEVHHVNLFERSRAIRECLGKT